MSLDEGLAEHLLSQPDPPEKPPVRRWSEYSVSVELLAGIFDRLAEIPNAIAASNGGKPRKVKPYPRPVTAIDKMRDKRAVIKHRATVARVLPRGADLDAFSRGSDEPSPPPKRRRRGAGVRPPALPGQPLFPDNPT